MIAIADVSGSMTVDDSIPLYNSIGLSIRVSEKASSAFRDRIITFPKHQHGSNLMVVKHFVKRLNCEKSTLGNEYKYLHCAKMVLDGIIESDMSAIGVENMAIIVFSDMQINTGSSFSNTVMNSIIDVF